ncbi:MAG: hypothetical protein ACR2MS_08265, partial [Weeksellaceae bacterium]
IKDRLKWAQAIEKFNVLLDEYLDYHYTKIIYTNVYNHYKTALKWSIKQKNLKKIFISTLNYGQYYIKLKTI